MNGRRRAVNDHWTPAIATRLILLCHAATPMMREGRFPAPGDRADAIGLRGLDGVRISPVPTDRVVTAPAAVARQTADALGWTARVDDALRDVDFGDWAGRTLTEVQSADPEGVAGWITRAGGGPDDADGAALRARVSGWLDRQAESGGRAIAIGHAGIFRVAMGHALGMSTTATARIDLAPLTAVCLSHHRGWRLQAIMPAA